MRQLRCRSICGLGFALVAVNFAAHAQTIPSAPTNLQATAVSPFQINLSWIDTSTNEDGFMVERSLDGTNFTQIAQLLPNTAVYRHTSLFPGTTYYYRVRAFNAGGASGYSNGSAASTLDICAPNYVPWGNTAGGLSTPPAGITNPVAIAAGEGSYLVLQSNGTVVGWGWYTGVASPPAGLTGVVAIADFIESALALQSDGTIIGLGNAPTPPALTGVVAVAVGYNHGLALETNGTVVAWGDNSWGQTNVPAGLSGVVAIAAGGYHSLALKSDGTVVGWGMTNFGEATVPAGLSNVVAVAGGSYFSLALKSDGTVVAWGDNSNGQTNVPAGLGNVVSVAAGMDYALALKSDGTMVGWGDNYYGEASPPSGASGAVSIAAGDISSLALLTTFDAPSGFTATAVSTNQVNLTWTINGSPDGFNILRAANNNGTPGPWSQIATLAPSSNTFSDVGLLPNTVYWYQVQAFPECSLSISGLQTNVSTLPYPPLAPTNLTATPLSASQVALSWIDTNNDETGFSVERAPDVGGSPGSFVQLVVYGYIVTNYLDSGLTTNTTYWYRVRAANVGGYSPPSNLAEATTYPSSFDSWNSPFGGKWESSSYGAPIWSLLVPPSINMSGVLITNAGSKTVTIDAATVSNSPSTLTISNLTMSAQSGATNTLLLSTSGSTNLLHVIQVISLASGGLVDVENSSLQVDSFNSKTGSTIDGTLVVQDGGRMTLSREGQLQIGNVATGQMVISTGTVLGASTIDVGFQTGSQGTLVISNAATVDISSLSIGQNNNSSGAVWMSGGLLATTNGGQPNVLYVGYGGAGQMTVSNGVVLSARAYVGYGAAALQGPGSPALGTLTVAGGSVTLSSALYVGYGFGPAGPSPAATGTVWLTGGQLSVTNGTTIVGNYGSGQLVVTGGTMQASSVTLGQNAGSQGSVTVPGGTVTISSSLVVGDCATTASGQVTVVSGGSLFITNASHTAFLDVRHGTLIVGNGGMLQVDKLVMTNACGLLVRNGGTLIVSNLVLDPNLSALGDGIPNGWKQQYGLNPLDPNLANEDLNGNGFTILQDYLAGTDPTNSSSAFRITAIAPVGTDIRIYFTSVSSNYYSLQRADFMGGAWTAIVTNIPGNNAIQWVKDIGAATRTSAVYRIELLPLTNAPPADSDGDGIPDWWTQQYFGHPTGQAADNSLATADPDGDGFSNLQEYLAGTDPTNPASSFRIVSVVPSGIDLLVTWMMGSNRTNALQATAGDANGSYDTNSFTDIFTVTNTVSTMTNFLDAGAATNVPSRYYRVRLVP